VEIVYAEEALLEIFLSDFPLKLIILLMLLFFSHETYATEQEIKCMARQQSLDILLSGKRQWNTWRQTYPDVQAFEPDLHKADLTEADLRGIDFHGADLTEANLQQTDLREAHLQETDLRHANLQHADLSDANLSKACLRGTDLRGAKLCRTNLRAADLSNADLRGADLSDADFTKAILNHAQFDDTKVPISVKNPTDGSQKMHQEAQKERPAHNAARAATA
jgi:hypothetical protein